MSEQALAVLAFVVFSFGGLCAALYFSIVWFLSRETHIEPIVSEGERK